MTSELIKNLISSRFHGITRSCVGSLNQVFEETRLPFQGEGGSKEELPPYHRPRNSPLLSHSRDESLYVETHWFLRYVTRSVDREHFQNPSVSSRVPNRGTDPNFSSLSFHSSNDVRPGLSCFPDRRRTWFQPYITIYIYASIARDKTATLFFLTEDLIYCSVNLTQRATPTPSLPALFRKIDHRCRRELKRLRTAHKSLDRGSLCRFIQFEKETKFR